MLRPDLPVARQAEPPPPSEPLCDLESGDLSPGDAIAPESHPLDPRISDLLIEVCARTGASGAALALEEGDGEFYCRGAVGATAPDLGLRIDVRHGLTAECLRSGLLQVCDNAERDPRVGREACRRLGIRSTVVVPLILNGCPRGLLAIYSPIVRAFGSVDLQHLDILARKITNLLTAARTAPVAREEETGREEAHRAQELRSEAVPEGVSMPAPEPPVAATVTLADTRDTAPDAAFTESQEILEPTPVTETAALLPHHAGREQWPWINRMLALTVVAAAVLLGWMISLSYHVGPAPKKTSTPAPVATVPPAPTKPAPVQSPALTSAPAAQPPLISASQNSAVKPSAPDELIVYEKNRVVFRMHARSPAGENSAPSSVLPLAIPESASPVSESQATQVAAHPGTSLPASAKVTGGDVISRVSPIAPPEAAQLGLRGDVVLQVTIAKDGTIGPIHPLSGDSRLIPSAVDAVRQWRYQPFLEDGKPIEVQGKITIHYGTAQPASQNPSPEPPASVPQ